MCQLNLANKIPKILLPTCNEDNPEGQDNKSDDFLPGQVDLDDSDIGLTFEKVRAHQVLVDGDFRDKTCHGEQNQEVVPNFTPKENEQRNTIENEDYKDRGEWLLDQLDLTGIEEWPEELKVKANDMLKRNASIFSKHDLDMDKTNLVKHNIVLTDSYIIIETYGDG